MKVGHSLSGSLTIGIVASWVGYKIFDTVKAYNPSNKVKKWVDKIYTDNAMTKISQKVAKINT